MNSKNMDDYSDPTLIGSGGNDILDAIDQSIAQDKAQASSAPLVTVKAVQMPQSRSILDDIDDSIAQDKALSEIKSSGHKVMNINIGGQPHSIPQSNNDIQYSDIPVPQNISPETMNAYGAGLDRGIRNVGGGLEKLVLSAANKTGLVDDQDYKDVKDLQALSLNQYRKEFNGNKLADLGEFLGETGTSLPLLAAGGEVAGGAAGVASDVIPTLGAVGDYIKGNSLLDLLGKGATGASQGAAANVVTSGASNDSLADRAKSGAEFGGAVGTAVPVLRYLGRAVKAGIAPFTESGRNNLANQVIINSAGRIPNVNPSQIVPGSNPTLAEAIPGGNAGVSGLQRTVRDLPGNGINQFTEREQANAEARKNLLLNTTGTPQDIEASQAIQSAIGKKALGDPDNGVTGEIFKNSSPVDIAPVKSSIQDILNGVSGNRPAVSMSMGKINSMLKDSNGNDITDPEVLYHSVRKGMDDLLDQKDITNQAGKQASTQILKVKAALDAAIEEGAPGFKKYLGDYTQASIPVNAMDWMQKLNLTDSKGNVTLTQVQNALKNVDKLQRAPGISSAKSVSADQISALRSIRDDLLRQSNTTLGKSAGSNTVQNVGSQNFLSKALPGNLGVLSKPLNPTTVGSSLGGGLGYILGNPAGTGALSASGGAALGGVLGNIFSRNLAEKNSLITEAIRNKLLNPSQFNPKIPNNDQATNTLVDLIKNNYIPASILGNNIRSSSQ